VTYYAVMEFLLFSLQQSSVSGVRLIFTEVKPRALTK